MSSMVRLSLAALVFSLALASPASAQANGQDGAEWDQARLQNAANRDPAMAQAIARWKLLTSSDRFAFGDYASFLLSYPGFPEEVRLRAGAERALDREYAEAARVVAYFDRFPPQTNPARAHYAIALWALRRPQAGSVALEAWRGGPMSDTAEATLFAQYATAMSLADHDARMNALLWA
ncbi:MAG: hypothetical protein ACREUQ_11845, partial [Burkholderiales bacterium]